MKLGSKLSVRFLKRTRFRSGLIILTIAISTLLMLFTVNQSYKLLSVTYQVEKEQNGEFSGVFSGLTLEQVRDLEADLAIKSIGKKAFLEHVRINEDDILNLFMVDEGYRQGMSIQMKEGRLPKEMNEVILPQHLIKGYGGWESGMQVDLDIGITDYLTGDVSYSTRQYEVVGVFKDLAYFETGNGFVYEGFAGGGMVNPRIYFERSSEAHFDAEAFVEEHGLEKHQYTSMLFLDRNSHFATMFTPVIGVILLVVLTACVAIVNIFSYSIIERTKMIGLLRAVGMTRKQVKDKIRTERNILYLYGVGLGILLSMVMHFIWVAYENHQGKLNIIVFDKVMLLAILGIALIVFIMVSIGVSLSAMKVNSSSIVKMIRFEGRRGKRKKSKTNKGNVILNMAMRKLTDHKISFVTSFLLFGLSVASFIVIMSLFNSMDSEPLIKYYNIRDFELENDWFVEDNAISTSIMDQLKHIEGIETVHETRLTLVEMSDSDLKRDGNESYGINVLAFDEAMLASIMAFDDIEGGLAEDECFIYDRYEFSGMEAGDSVEIAGQSYTVIGKLEYLPNQVNRGRGVNYFQTCFILPEISNDYVVSHIAVDIKDGVFEQVKGKIKLILPDRGVSSDFIDETIKELEDEDRTLRMAFYGFATMIAVINFTVIINSIVTSIIYRRRDFGMLQAIGMTSHQIKRQLYIEGGMLSLVGSIVGITGGVLTAFILISDMATVNPHINVRISLQSVMIAFLYLLVILLTISKATEQVHKISVIKNIRHE